MPRFGRVPAPVLNGPVRMLRALPVLPVVLLAGCGVAATQFHPGIAAEVGNQTITTRHVDQVTEDYCEAVEKVSKGQPEAQDARTPMRYLSHTFATNLIMRDAAEQLADDYDVQPTSAYKGNLAQLEPQLANLSDDQKEAVREIFGAQAYVDDVLTQIGEISLKKIVAAVDCGIQINPDTVRAQIEGGVLVGLSAALFNGITFDDGRVQQGNFNDYRQLRINETPPIEVHLLDSGEGPGGLGEVGTVSAAPALGNAIFAATGVRVRCLPIDRRLLSMGESS